VWRSPWAADNNGPKAPLGTHSVRLTVDGQARAQSFGVLKDARLTGIVSDADIQDQFDLALQVRNRTSDANQGVINIRACTAQVDDRIVAADDSEVTQQGTTLKNAHSAVENELYQTRLRSNQDPLNFGTCWPADSRRSSSGSPRSSPTMCRGSTRCCSRAASRRSRAAP
jgi:hypothetical protein